MQQNIEFERCIDFLISTAKKSSGSWRKKNRIRKKKKRHFPYLATCLSCIALNFSTRELSGTIHNREVLLSRRQ